MGEATNPRVHYRKEMWEEEVENDKEGRGYVNVKSFSS
jgi:hypothetical protein